MATLMRLVISICLVFISSSSCSHGHVPRITFPLGSSGRPFSLFTLPDVYNTTTLLLSEDEKTLFVGARDAVLSLNISNGGIPQLSKKLNWSAPEKNISECTRRGNREMDCKNFVRVLQVINSTHMFVCGTFAFSPSCSYIDSEHFSLLTGREEVGRGRCPYNPFQRNTAITVGGELYTGTVADYRGTRPSISRHLSESSRVDMKLEDSVGWLEEPTFISSAFIPSEQKVYFFFSEVGREYDFVDKFTVSRIAQVCTSDVGGQRTLQKRWTTFTKAQLLCKDKGELPYNVLQDITTLTPPVGASEDDTLFYGIFSSQWSLNSARSAVCVFSLRAVKAVFAGNYKVLNKDSLKWSSHLQEKIAKPGQCGLHNASDNELRFVKDRFLADESVLPANERLSLVSSDKRYSNIAAQRVLGAHGTEYIVLYLLTESGHLQKAVLLENGAHVIEEIQVFEQPQSVKNLLLSVSQHKVFVGSSEGVASIPITNCSHYWSCAQCVLARDPFCGWDLKHKVCAEVSKVEGDIAQDIYYGNASLICYVPPTPRSRSTVSKDPPGALVLVHLNELVHLECPSSSKLAQLHWEKSGMSLPSKMYMQHKDGSLSFVATPSTMGTYKCQAVENGFTQTLTVYEVTQKDASMPKPSTSTFTTTHFSKTTKQPMTAIKFDTIPKIDKPKERAQLTTLQATTVEVGMSRLKDGGSCYLRELVAVSVLLVLSLCTLLLVAMYSLRKRFHSRTAPHASNQGGAAEHEKEALRGKQGKQNGQNHEGKSAVTSSDGPQNDSNGHLPNIPV